MSMEGNKDGVRLFIIHADWWRRLRSNRGIYKGGWGGCCIIYESRWHELGKDKKNLM